MYPFDREYRLARRAKQGKLRLDTRYDGFVRRVGEQFGVEPLWIRAHRRLRDGRPALDIVFERTADYERFTLGAWHEFDPQKQLALATLFLAEVPEVTPGWFTRWKAWPKPTDANELFVCFRDFESVAELAAHSRVRGAEWRSFTASIDLADDLWRIERGYGRPVVFVLTAARAQELKNSEGLLGRWADAYFALVTTHDEFGYLTREEVVVDVDSKEILDAQYEGSLYSYFR
jgi:hypothetical protein